MTTTSIAFIPPDKYFQAGRGTCCINIAPIFSATSQGKKNETDFQWATQAVTEKEKVACQRPFGGSLAK